MNEDRRQILQMLSDGKVTADEAERLFAALEAGPRPLESPGGAVRAGARPKYLRVVVDAEDPNHPNGQTKVNVRVPMQLLRAGVRLGALIPAHARDRANEAMREHGVQFDLSQLKPENLEDLIEQLNELTVDVDQEKTKVRVFCE